MKRNFHWRIWPGVLLMLVGLIGLYTVPDCCQYVFLPDGTDYARKLSDLEQTWEGVFPALSLHGTAEAVSLTHQDRSQGEVTLYEVLGGYSEVYPRRYISGRSLSRGDKEKRVIVLDEALAFQLFRDQDPLEQEVTLADKSYQVVGVASHQRRPGETGTYAAWIPLGAEGAPACTVMTLSAAGKASAGLWTQFESGARDAFGAGQALFSLKERMRSTILLRAVLILLAIRLLTLWIRRMKAWTGAWSREIREKLKTHYPRQMPGTLLGRSASALLLIAGTIAAGAALVVWAVQPMLFFPEWVPEVLVEPEAIARRFWELTAAAASPLRFTTAETAEIRLWGGVLRWGIVLTLLGYLLDQSKHKRKTAE